MDNKGKKIGRFILGKLVNSAGLTYDQVAVMEAKALQNHLLLNGLCKQEILSVKRLRKRVRIKRKNEFELLYLMASIQELNKRRYSLLIERKELQEEVNNLRRNLSR